MGVGGWGRGGEGVGISVRAEGAKGVTDSYMNRVVRKLIVVGLVANWKGSKQQASLPPSLYLAFLELQCVSKPSHIWSEVSKFYTGILTEMETAFGDVTLVSDDGC